MVFGLLHTLRLLILFMKLCPNNCVMVCYFLLRILECLQIAPLLNETKAVYKKHLGGSDKYQKHWKCQKLVCLW